MINLKYNLKVNINFCNSKYNWLLSDIIWKAKLYFKLLTFILQNNPEDKILRDINQYLKIQGTYEESIEIEKVIAFPTLLG